ncbi:MAG: hypothetical protein LJE70_07450 [Chromatiaceae bacterium]|nr:hypothetical protein [Chromatiaceae bacterium]
MQSAKNETRGRSGVLGAVVAVATAMAVSPAFGLAQTSAQIPAEPPAVVPTEAPAATEIPAAAHPAANDAAAPARAVTPEQIYTAMIEAEKTRRELWRPDPAVPKALAEQWGVQVIGVQLTAGGYWLRFAFRVKDADKAGMLFDNRYKTYLESEKTGVKLAVPTAAKVGALRTTNRQGNIKNGKIYTIMFSNPGAQVKPGHKVAVVAGEFKVEHLTVN